MERVNIEEAERNDLERNQTWENNQVLITNTIDLLTRKNERQPTQNEIAEKSGLSRKTVNVHLREYRRIGAAEEELEQFKFMASKILGKIMEKAMDGDMRASRLSLQVMGLLGRPPVSKEK